jgi:hypothetical protein
MPRTIRKIGVPTAEGINDVWQRRATAAAILAVRDVIRGGAIPAAARVERLTDIELGWLFTAALFGWIKTRAEQATAEGWDVEETLRLTSLNPQPWDAGAVESILPQLGTLPDIDWSKAIGHWSKDQMVRFLLQALGLIDKAMIARDFGGSITTRRKSLDEMQRTASAEAGGPLMTPGEFNDPIGI